ncbi:hypothetical protein AYK24_03285 [Thermoplasmatales archaeon SG8-52-4]|nr:MAG: hypothetical protein AYK24_03285 [Thermoplasmatales archaeon SG8-52-4]
MELKLWQIKKDGYRSLSMQDAFYSRNSKKDKLIHLNYDDGYLDNWIHLFPILENLKLKATIYVSADFIDPREIVREQNNTYDHYHKGPENCCAGFLSFPEMRKMENSGLVEIQSHAKTHTWYFKGSKIVDFWHPGSATKAGGPVWMLWNRFPESKPFYLTEADNLESKIPYGTPIYEHGKSLETRRYYPGNEKLEKKLIEHAASDPYFFKKNNWINELNQIVNRENENSKGCFETEKEYFDRVNQELSESKNILEIGLGHPIEGICWPGGGVEKEVVILAKSIGYKYFTLPSKWKRSPNEFYHEMIPRISSLSKVTFNGKIISIPTSNDFSLYLKAMNGIKLSKFIFFIKRAFKFLKNEL